MKIGFYSPEITGDGVTTVFARARQLGFSQVQYSFETSHGEEMPAEFLPGELDVIRDASRDHDMEIVAINGTFNMIDVDRVRRREYIRRFERIAQACKRLDCKIITLCTGSRHPQSGWTYHPDSALDDAWRDLMATTRQLLRVAEEYDLRLGVETEASNVVFDAERTRRYLDEAGSSRLRVIMDCANLFPAGTATPDQVEPRIRRAFDLLSENIILAHGKDIQASDTVKFAAPGMGIVDYGLFFSLLKQRGYDRGLILHGIHDQADFAPSVQRMREALAQAGM